MKCLSPRFSSVQNAYVPCGQCYYCRQRKKYEWVCRSLMERFSFDNGYFITLTYDNEHLPEDRGVSKWHAKYFLDEMRKVFLAHEIPYSYYLMSEYGGRSQRAHYHMHLFTDAPLSFVSSVVSSLWKYGFNKIGTTTLKSVLYTSAFHLLPKEHMDKYPKPNFHMMTRGLGKNFVDKWKSYYQQHDRRVFEFSGFKFNLPPYIRDSFGLPKDSFTTRDLDLWSVKNEFYLGRIKEGRHSRIYVDWDLFVNHMNNKLVVKGLKNKI